MSIPFLAFGSVILTLWFLTMTDTVDAEKLFSRRDK